MKWKKMNEKPLDKPFPTNNTFIRYLQNSLLTNEVSFSHDITQNQYKNLLVTWISELVSWSVYSLWGASKSGSYTINIKCYKKCT